MAKIGPESAMIAPVAGGGGGRVCGRMGVVGSAVAASPPAEACVRSRSTLTTVTATEGAAHQTAHGSLGVGGCVTVICSKIVKFVRLSLPGLCRSRGCGGRRVQRVVGWGSGSGGGQE